jgi:hypothetical protein
VTLGKDSSEARRNPNSMSLLEKNDEKINWYYFLSTFRKELIEWQFHPKNQHKWEKWGINNDPIEKKENNYNSFE